MGEILEKHDEQPLINGSQQIEIARETKERQNGAAFIFHLRETPRHYFGIKRNT